MKLIDTTDPLNVEHYALNFKITQSWELKWNKNEYISDVLRYLADYISKIEDSCEKLGVKRVIDINIDIEDNTFYIDLLRSMTKEEKSVAKKQFKAKKEKEDIEHVEYIKSEAKRLKLI